jgi:hypothetical protein
VFVKPKDNQGKVRYPINSIDSTETSYTDSGLLWGRTLVPLEVSFLPGKVAEAVVDALDCDCDPRLAQIVVLGLPALLESVRSKWGLKPDSGTVTLRTLPFRHKAPYAGLICNGPGGKKAVVMIEGRSQSKEAERTAVHRGASITMILSRSQKRRNTNGRQGHVCEVFHPRTPILKAEPGADSCLVCLAVHMPGLPLQELVLSVLKPWHERRELTEQQRYCFSGTFRGIDNLQDIGYRFGPFDPNAFVMTKDYVLKLVFAGGGFLGDRKREQCERTGKVPGQNGMMRRNTSNYLSDGGKCLPANMNLRRLNVLEKKQFQQSSQRPASSSDDDASDAPSAGASALAVVVHATSDSNLREWNARTRGTNVGLLGDLRFDAEQAFMSDDLARQFKEDGTPVDMDMMREADVQQVILWLISTIRGVRNETFTTMKKYLTEVLDSKKSMVEVCQSMQNFLQGRAPLGREFRGEQESGLKCNQPAALLRLVHLAVLALHPDYSALAAQELSYFLFATTVVHTPTNEGLLSSGPGIAMTIRLFPFDGEAFKEIVLGALRGVPGIDAYQSRVVYLRNEGEKGPGVYAPGKWEKGHFFGFYLGSPDDPHGRHVVRSMGRAVPHCNGAASYDLPFETILERGTPGAHVNAAIGKDNGENLRLDRTRQIVYEFACRKWVLIPMFVKVEFQDAFTGWDYDPHAGDGSSFQNDLADEGGPRKKAEKKRKPADADSRRQPPEAAAAALGRKQRRQRR